MKGGVVQHVADGQAGLQLLELAGQTFAELDAVHSRHDRDADDDGLPVVVVGQLARRIAIAASNSHHLRDRNDLLAAGNAQHDVLDVLDALEVARGIDDQFLLFDVVGAAGQDHVLTAQGGGDVGHIDAELGELGVGVLEKDLLLLDAVELDLANAVQLIEPVADIAGDEPHLGHGKAVAPQGDGGDGGQPELVVDEGADRALR